MNGLQPVNQLRSDTSQVAKKVISRRLPGLDIGRVLFVLTDSLVEQALLRFAQSVLLDLLCDPLIGRKSPERLDDFLGIHLHIISDREGTPPHP